MILSTYDAAPAGYDQVSWSAGAQCKQMDVPTVFEVLRAARADRELLCEDRYSLKANTVTILCRSVQ